MSIINHLTLEFTSWKQRCPLRRKENFSLKCDTWNTTVQHFGFLLVRQAATVHQGCFGPSTNLRSPGGECFNDTRLLPVVARVFSFTRHDMPFSQCFQLAHCAPFWIIVEHTYPHAEYPILQGVVCVRCSFVKTSVYRLQWAL